jgi:hypothetical protein
MQRVDIKVFVTIMVVFAIVAATFLVWRGTSGPYPQATGIFPQVVSCVDEHPYPQAGRNWRPLLTVHVEPNRDVGRVREYRMYGCSFYYYHGHSQGASGGPLPGD